MPVSPQAPNLETLKATIDNVEPPADKSATTVPEVQCATEFSDLAKGVDDVTMYRKALEVVTLGFATYDLYLSDEY